MTNERNNEPKRGEDYYYWRPPSSSFRLWTFAVAGVVCLIVGLVLLVGTTFDWIIAERPWEEISTLFVVGATFIYWGTPNMKDVYLLDMARREMRRMDKEDR